MAIERVPVRGDGQRQEGDADPGGDGHGREDEGRHQQTAAPYAAEHLHVLLLGGDPSRQTHESDESGERAERGEDEQGVEADPVGQVDAERQADDGRDADGDAVDAQSLAAAGRGSEVGDQGDRADDQDRQAGAANDADSKDRRQRRGGQEDQRGSAEQDQPEAEDDLVAPAGQHPRHQQLDADRGQHHRAGRQPGPDPA